MSAMNNDIDFVITWVDGNDEVWKNENRKYSAQLSNDDKEERYRDFDLLKYWFRGVEKYASWVRKIHFITWGHVPEWLDTNNEKIHIVNHKDIIPEEVLPVFNSNAIEIFMHRIEGLSDNFVYFNDDIMIIDYVKKTDYFIDNKPCDMLAFQPVVANPANPVMSYLLLNNTVILSKYFNKRENVKMQPGKYFKLGYPPLYFFYNMLEMAFPLFTGFYTVHGPMPFCISTFEEIWAKERDTLMETASHRFRSDRDVTPYLFREWQKLKGEFIAKNIQKKFRYYNLSNDNSKLLKTIRKQKVSVICINDANEFIEFDRVKKEITDAFLTILPEKSSFEK